MAPRVNPALAARSNPGRFAFGGPMADPLILNQRDPSQLYGQTGTAVIDFGAFPGRSDASVAVTGQSAITANAVLDAWIG